MSCGNMYGLVLLLNVYLVNCMIWNKGVVHYTINSKDYDLHSQDEIITTLSQMQREICIKFFNTPYNHTLNEGEKMLYIHNPDKIKSCPPNGYDFHPGVVDMPIGYKCITRRDVSRIVVDMLRASIEETVPTINSYDLVKKFREKNQDTPVQSLLSPEDRNFINAHYNHECQGLVQLVSRKSGDSVASGELDNSPQLSEANFNYYEDKLWPLGIVMYGVDEKLRKTSDFSRLLNAMLTIEYSTCIVFRDMLNKKDALDAKNFLWFASDGDDMPKFGFQEGNQTLKLSSITNGAPGHTAHTINNLMRVLAIHMMSNRFDRDNYVTIHWSNVASGKEQYLEKMPFESWIFKIPYDYNSVTHAPANYECGACGLGGYTVQPLQDDLWQKTMAMGHASTLSDIDIQIVNILYAKQCLIRRGLRNK